MQSCENASRITFPEDYKALLKFSDGCMLRGDCFVIFFSCGVGFHEKETIEFANKLFPDVDMFFIGRFSGEMFGYLKNEKDCRIYSYFEETGEKRLIADDIDDFMHKYIMPPEKKSFWKSLFS